MSRWKYIHLVNERPNFHTGLDLTRQESALVVVLENRGIGEKEYDYVKFCEMHSRYSTIEDCGESSRRLPWPSVIVSDAN